MYRSLVSRVKYDDGQSKYGLGTIVVLNVNPNVVGIGVEWSLIHSIDYNWDHHGQQYEKDKNYLWWKTEKIENNFKVISYFYDMLTMIHDDKVFDNKLVKKLQNYLLKHIKFCHVQKVSCSHYLIVKTKMIKKLYLELSLL